MFALDSTISCYGGIWPEPGDLCLLQENPLFLVRALHLLTDRQVLFGASLQYGQGDCVGNVEAYPPPVSAHVDDGDSVDPSRTVDTHLVAGAVAGDRGSQRRVQRDPLTGDVCLSWHNDGVLGVPEIIPHHDSRA